MWLEGPRCVELRIHRIALASEQNDFIVERRNLELQYNLHAHHDDIAK